ncbi:DUF551 domain-containing protein [Pseudomonas sp. CJQ_11]|uniref:DUF551 domain-containing protein n=1 Tax=Pseudomonas sp. CJQ_11 TaxID=3367169 RepID=UPI00370A4E6A
MTGWIKCSDRLPTDIDPVLAFGQSDSNDTEHAFIGWTDGDKWFEVNNGDYIDGGYGDDYDAVATHWQPLPDDPTD